MAGSIKTLIYTTNDGTRYAYKADESNLENLQVVAGSFNGVGDFLPADESAGIQWRPTKGVNFQPRCAIYADATGRYRKVIDVPTQAMFTALNSGDTANVNLEFTEVIQGVTVLFKLVRLIGETIARPVSFDSAIDDGDDT